MTVYVDDFSAAVQWYVHFFKKSPVYIDESWALFKAFGVTICLVNKPLLKEVQFWQQGLSQTNLSLETDGESLMVDEGLLTEAKDQIEIYLH